MQRSNIFQSLDKLRIILFWEILKEKNPFLLDANFKPENNYTEEEQEFIVNTWERLYDEFFEAKNDSKGRVLLKESEDEMKLLYKINLLIDLRNHLVKLFEHVEIIPMQVYEELKFSAFNSLMTIEKKLKIDVFTSIPNAVKLIDRALGSLQNTYTIKSKRNNQEVDKQIENVYLVVAKVEQAIGMAIPNINEMSVLQWLAKEKVALEITQSKKDSKNGKK